MKKGFLFNMYARIISTIVFIMGFTASVCAQYGAPVYEKFVFKGFIKSNNKTGNVSGLKVTAKSSRNNLGEYRMTSDANGAFTFSSRYYYHFYTDSINFQIEDSSHLINGKPEILKDTAILLSKEKDGEVTINQIGYEDIEYVFKREFYIGEPDKIETTVVKPSSPLTANSENNVNSEVQTGKDKKKEPDNNINELAAEVSVVKSEGDLIPAVRISKQESPNPNEQQTPAGNPELKIFPNPGNGAYNLVFKNPGNLIYQVNVFDLQGQLMKSFELEDVIENQNYLLDISNFSAGSYLIQIKNQQWSFSKTVIKK